MKFRLLITTLLVVAVTASLIAPAHPEEEQTDPHDGMTEAWAKLAEPGENHEWLGFLVGKWHADVKFWMGPGEPQISEGTSETSWILGKRFLRTRYTGRMEDKPFEGFATIGFNNITSEYQSAWADEMSTALVMASGKREKDVLTLKGVTNLPQMGKVPFRDVWTKVSQDEYTMEEFWTMEGMGEMRVMAITYKRIP